MLTKIGQKLARTFYPYGSTRTVLLGPIRGTKYMVEPGIGISYSLGTGNTYFDFFIDKLKPGMVVYDIGANRGQMSLFFSRYVGKEGHVVAVEPVPSLYESLTKNIQINDISNVITICAAASDSNGSITFSFNAERSTKGRLIHESIHNYDPNSQKLQVDAIALDSWLDNTSVPSPPDFIKIDVEGGAKAVLAGLRKTLDTVSPPIYIELHGQQEIEAVHNELVTRGYTIESLDGRNLGNLSSEPIVSPLFCYKP